MPGKRSKRNNFQFHCPSCNSKMWRLGSPKHFLFYQGATEIQRNVDMPRKSALFLANKGVYIDNRSWIEEFFCRKHGKLWIKVTNKTNSKLVTTLATGNDWQQSTRTIDPDTPNPSVGEFTYRMSRQAGRKLSYSI